MCWARGSTDLQLQNFVDKLLCPTDAANESYLEHIRTEKAEYIGLDSPNPSYSRSSWQAWSITMATCVSPERLTNVALSRGSLRISEW